MFSRISSHFLSHRFPLHSTAAIIPPRRHFSWVFRPRFDYQWILNNSSVIEQNLKDRGLNNSNPKLVFQLIQHKNTLESNLFTLRPKQDSLTNSLKFIKDPNERSNSIAEAKKLKLKISIIESELNELLLKLELETSKLPNLTSSSTPIGPELSSRVMELVNSKPIFNDFQPQSHISLSRKHELIEFDQAAIVSGSRFHYLRNELAILELGLINYSMKFYMERGFAPVLTPDLVHTNFIYSMGFQPRDSKETQIYHLESDWNLSLVGTAEIPMAGLFANRVIEKSKAPIKTVSMGHAFRTEAGGLGRENKGLYRVHQFSKVELFYVSSAADSTRCFEELISLQKEFYQSLGIHFRLLEIASEDLGNPAYRKIDCEALMPGKGLESANPTEDYYGEISSASNCLDFQSRRLNIRIDEGTPVFDPKKIEKLDFAHTLNGTACAIPRLLIAIMEQFQRADGSIEIPSVLKPFMMGIESIPSSVIKNRNT